MVSLIRNSESGIGEYAETELVGHAVAIQLRRLVDEMYPGDSLAGKPYLVTIEYPENSKDAGKRVTVEIIKSPESLDFKITETAISEQDSDGRDYPHIRGCSIVRTSSGQLALKGDDRLLAYDNYDDPSAEILGYLEQAKESHVHSSVAELKGLAP